MIAISLFKRYSFAGLFFSMAVLMQDAYPEEAVTLDLGSIRWLAGSWSGTAETRDGTGRALSLWTEALAGAMSWTFRWHVPKTGHSHYAFNVIEDTGEGVFIRGIHHGRDFQSFEQHHWSYRLDEVASREARFVCQEHCRAEAVTFTLLESGELREAWTSDGDPGAFVVVYNPR